MKSTAHNAASGPAFSTKLITHDASPQLSTREKQATWQRMGPKEDELPKLQVTCSSAEKEFCVNSEGILCFNLRNGNGFV